MASREQPGDGRPVVFGRQPARIVEGQLEGPYTDAFVITCCGCDHPRRIAARPHPGFSGSAGHDRIADGIAAGKKHLGLQLAGAACGGR
jgi:hypothetical protein